ncbi:histone acetyltransferase p300 [Trichonephila clavipes]|nr:histone acetyltransferase p300 [Trichonephila clavipes]
MPNLPSQIIPDMLDWRQIWRSVRSKKTTRFNSVAVQFPRAFHRSKRGLRLVGVTGSTRNGRLNPKCPSARLLRMVREDTKAPSEVSTCARTAVDEEVGYTRAFLTMLWSSL